MSFGLICTISFFKSTMTDFIFQAIRVLGLLGALDPYKYKEITLGSIEATAKAASSEPITSTDQTNETGT